MLNHPRLALLGGQAALALLCGALALVGPISVAREAQPALAAPALDITATAPPATPLPTDPPATPVPTDPPATATATAIPATATPPTPTSTPPARTRVPATATPPAPTSTPTADGRRPNVVIAKAAEPATIRAGQLVVFTIAARNTGAATARDVVLTDVVPDLFQVTDLASTQGDLVVDGQTVTAYPATLAPGASVTIRVTARARPDAPAGASRNTALVTTSTPGDDPGDNTSTTVVMIEPPQRPRQAAPRLPRTAGPDAPTLLLAWGPWLVLALGLCGGLLRFGHPRLAQLDLDAEALVLAVRRLLDDAIGRK